MPIHVPKLNISFLDCHFCQTSAAGEYQVNVTAYNPVNSKSAGLVLLVQRAPDGLELDKDWSKGESYFTALGNATNFQVSVTSGTDVHFDWDFGDGTYQNNAGGYFMFIMFIIMYAFVSFTALK